MKTPEKYRRRRIERYETRKVEQRCVQCDAGLQEDDGVRCVECTKAGAAAKKRYESKAKNRANKRERQRKYRADRQAKGICAACPNKVNGRALCEACTIKQAERSKRNHALRRQGVIVLATEARKREAKQREPVYIPLDEKLDSNRGRVLRAMEHRDWSRMFEIIEQICNVDHESKEYDALNQLICRYAKSGLVERRGFKNAYEYRITDVGRAALAELRRVA